MTVIIFWITVTAILVGGAFYIRRNNRRTIHVFALINVIIFEVICVLHVRIFIFNAWSGNSDTFMGMGIGQALINPIRLVFFQYPSRWLLKVPPEIVVDNIACVITLNLWQVLVEDMILGAVFWYLTSYGILRLLEKWFGKSETGMVG